MNQEFYLVLNLESLFKSDSFSLLYSFNHCNVLRTAKHCTAIDTLLDPLARSISSHREYSCGQDIYLRQISFEALVHKLPTFQSSAIMTFPSIRPLCSKLNQCSRDISVTVLQRLLQSSRTICTRNLSARIGIRPGCYELPENSFITSTCSSPNTLLRCP